MGLTKLYSQIKRVCLKNVNESCLQLVQTIRGGVTK